MTQKTILLTWATGYIGSHAVVAFEKAGYKTVIIDNLINSSVDSLQGISKILGYIPDFYEGDIRDRGFLISLFEKYTFDAVIHFAWLKAVGESCDHPNRYHDNNIGWSISLFWVMQEFGVKKIIFSSSATVYRADNISPITESMPLGTTNPYGTTKLVIEYLLEDMVKQKDWSVMALRYFNPIGAHPSGYIGEVPQGIPNNLLPYLFDVADAKRHMVNIYGNDYDTIDGTGVRDYIDVCDLIEAHILAYEKLDSGYEAINIWTGKGTSVFQMIGYVERASEKTIPYTVCPRRSGDIATVYCDPTLALRRLGWSAKTNIMQSVENGWMFIKNHK